MNEIEEIVTTTAATQSTVGQSCVFFYSHVFSRKGAKGQILEQEDHVESFAKHMKSKKEAEQKLAAKNSHILPPLVQNPAAGSTATSSGAAANADDDYDSDEEVYATAAAIDAAEGEEPRFPFNF